MTSFALWVTSGMAGTYAPYHETAFEVQRFALQQKLGERMSYPRESMLVRSI